VANQELATGGLPVGGTRFAGTAGAAGWAWATCVMDRVAVATARPTPTARQRRVSRIGQPMTSRDHAKASGATSPRCSVEPAAQQRASTCGNCAGAVDHGDRYGPLQ
jgi:hypothetical protein